MSKYRDDEWAEAKRRCRLTEEAVGMARELGLSPRSLIKNIPNPRQQWKAPVEEWVRSLHEKRFGQRPPERFQARQTCDDVSALEPASDAPNELEMAREELFRKLERGEVDVDTFAAEDSVLERETPVSGGEINQENRILLVRYETFRKFAALFAQVAAQLDFVQRIVLTDCAQRLGVSIKTIRD